VVRFAFAATGELVLVIESGVGSLDSTTASMGEWRHTTARAPLMIEAVARTHRGRRRAANEDACFADTSMGLFVVADGMGGHKAGAVASERGLSTVVDFVRQSRHDRDITWPFGRAVDQSFEENQLRNAIQLANQRIYREARSHREREGMGAAVVAALCRDARIAYANVGDSRLYRLRQDRLEQLSQDQSWVASMLRAGADPDTARTHPMRHVLTSALGSAAALHLRIDDAVLEDGDLLLLCSDGVHGLLPESSISAILGRRDLPLDARANTFIDANEAGGTDNITVVLVHYTASGGSEEASR
jgi:serine/threonine protein phosphatase PrpC